jgi:hypothetical protein
MINQRDFLSIRRLDAKRIQANATATESNPVYFAKKLKPWKQAPPASKRLESLSHPSTQRQIPIATSEANTASMRREFAVNQYWGDANQTSEAKKGRRTKRRARK